MKKLFLPTLLALTALLFTGCLELRLGGGPRTEAQYQNPTVGQQLIDLQRARDAGAISADEYQAQRAKLLQGK